MKSKKTVKTNIAEFPVFLEYDLEYKGFVADCPSLPGCMSQGKTKTAALKNIKDAISGYLVVLKKHEKTNLLQDFFEHKLNVQGLLLNSFND